MVNVDVTRRFFLGGALAVAAASVLPTTALAFSPVPVIVGDGIHDDADGLQAMFDGKPFRCETTIICDKGDFNLDGGRFFITKSLRIDGKGKAFSFCNGHIIADIKEGDCVLEIKNADKVLIRNNTFDMVKPYRKNVRSFINVKSSHFIMDGAAR